MLRKINQRFLWRPDFPKSHNVEASQRRGVNRVCQNVRVDPSCIFSFSIPFWKLLTEMRPPICCKFSLTNHRLLRFTLRHIQSQTGKCLCKRFRRPLFKHWTSNFQLFDICTLVARFLSPGMLAVTIEPKRFSPGCRKPRTVNDFTSLFPSEMTSNRR